jgi:CheY-like chemotaxis protein
LTGENLSLTRGSYVMLAVTDTGTGMSDSVRARAFEPFFTTKPKGKGTGLGLATVYGIVDQSGGGIAVDTAPGRGTAIRVYLPVTSTTKTKHHNTHVKPITGGGTETLLLVEDNDAVRQVTAEALRRRGYTVHEARNPDAAIEWSAESGIVPDLLVTDVVMLGQSGPAWRRGSSRSIPAFGFCMSPATLTTQLPCMAVSGEACRCCRSRLHRDSWPNGSA